MSKFKFITGCAAAAIVLATTSGAATAQTQTVGNVGQVTTNWNFVLDIGYVDVQNISGDGAGAQISAAGAISSVSGTVIQDYTDLSIGNVLQVTGNAGSVYTYGDVDNVGDISISGDGASISISAVGAASAVSVTGVGSNTLGTSLDDVTIGNVVQVTGNSGSVTTEHGDLFASASFSVDKGISGNGSSASVSASGAISSVSVATINNSASRNINIGTSGGVAQITTNLGNVTNLGGEINVGNISGKSASASISATGAASQVSVANINDTYVANVTVGNVAQATTNTGAVFNTGSVNAGNLSGNGSSVSVGAVGAASAVSLSVTN